MKKIISILLTLVMVFAMGAVTVFAAGTYTGNVTGIITSSPTGVITGSVTGDFNLTISGQITSSAAATNGTGIISAFTGTIGGALSGSITAGKMNDSGTDTIFAQITGTGASDPVYLIGEFPPCGTTGYFEGKIVTGTLPAGVTDVTITTTEGVTTAPVGGTLHMQLSSPTGCEVRWGVYVNDRTDGYASIDGNTLHILAMPADGNITVMASTLDPNVYSETIQITVTAPGTEVKANAGVTYTVVIPSSVNFGTINKSMPAQTKDFTVSVTDALIEVGMKIAVAGPTAEFMYAGSASLLFTLDQPNGIFNFTGNGIQTAHVGCTPANLTAAGSYTGHMTFTVSYVAA